jgi:hypothetical protein
MPSHRSTPTEPKERITIVLGAGASRGVSYAHQGEMPSPLDYDFFDLLQRLTPRKNDVESRERVLKAVSTLPHSYRASMEKSFYTLQLKAYLSEKLAGKPRTDEEVIRDFARCIQALLRNAHGKKRCDYHRKILSRLHRQDTVISFNYDLVPERALIETAEKRRVDFGNWCYGLDTSPVNDDLPLILKLHGSSNWKVAGENEFKGTITKDWAAFDVRPSYSRFKGDGTVFPIFLPFWDKRIEQGVWQEVWQTAYSRLRKTTTLIVWGYSLPSTDIKAQLLFELAAHKLERFCVIDPARATRERWREVVPDALYWEYNYVHEFLKYPPTWWKPA